MKTAMNSYPSVRRFSRRFVCSLTLLLLIKLNSALGQSASSTAIEPEGLANDPSRAAMVKELTDKAKKGKDAAERVALAKGWQIRGEDAQGRTFELIRLDEADMPIYYITCNTNAAISTGANLIRTNAPYNVNGAGFRVGVWDAGSVRSNHQEFTGRLFLMDGAPSHWHSTHCGGTIGAAGVDRAALGMAPAVRLDSYDWNSDVAEMTAAGATTTNHNGKILVSNHSYGLIAGWNTGNDGILRWWGTYPQREDAKFGRYGTEAASWDNICSNAPYYLPFKAAGNDRNNNAPAGGTTFSYVTNGNWVSKTYNATVDPFSDGWDNGGFDTMETTACAKNIMTIGAVNDATSGAVRVAANGTMSGFSGWGPTDDGRIKPDLVANGVNLYSTWDTATNAYSTISGTSMATPNAAGSAILLQQLYATNFAGRVMRASTLKGLLIQTADDLGRPGPDYTFGWGLMNVKLAADYIRSNASYSIIEGRLFTGKDTDTYTINWSGAGPVRATLCWTDPAGAPKTTLDNTNRVLVNDLDLRLRRNTTTNFPYVLNAASPTNNATTGDNIVDNVEQILLAAPTSGTYTITVSHKGTLTNGQDYALILSEGPANLTPYLPAGWSDKIVVSTVAGTSTDSPTLLSTDTLYVDMAVINIGAGATPAVWNNELYVDGVLKFTITGFTLNPGIFGFWTDWNIGSLSPGTHTILIRADAGGVVTEGNETDNQFTKTISVRPANDNFASAQTLTGTSGTVVGGNAFATKETGEPNHAAGNAGGRSVWYQWTAPITGLATIDTLTSSFDTLLGVYTGNAVNGLTLVANNDDFSPGSIYQSKVTFPAVAGTVYRIAVDGYGAAIGNITLHYLVVPPAPLVLNTNDSGPGSLRQLMADVAPGSIITFSNTLSGSTIRLTSGQLLLSKNLSIDASALSGGLTIDGNHSNRLFNVPGDISLSLYSLTLTNGAAVGDFGGAIVSSGNLTLNNCTLVGNTSGQGGAIQIFAGECSMVNCTVTANSSTGNGGAIDNSFGVGTLALTHCTFFGNSAVGSGAGIANYLRTLTLRNTIVAGNTGGGGDIVNFADSTIIRSGGNIVPVFSNGGTNIGPAAITAAPLLDTLGNYGGPTQTMPPVPGSPAINAGGPTGLTTDQRGLARLIGSAPDIGALELQTPNMVVTTTADSGVGSLRETIRQSDFSGVITFVPELSGANILLTSGQLVLSNKNITIDASALPEGIRIDGNTNGRIFQMIFGSTVVLDSLTLANGKIVGNGGGIYNSGLLTINRCTLFGNTATSFGGAIESDGNLTVNQSTFTANSCDGNGGGAIDVNTGSLVVNQSTISGNSAAAANGSGGIWGIKTINNSIIAGNSAPNFPNLFDTTTATGVNLTNGNPQLAALGNNGGPTLTMMPLAGSPAIDTGAATSFATDQRGFQRVADGDGNGTSIADIGAVEFVFVPQVSLANAQLVEGASGQTLLTFPVNLSGLSALPVTVHFETTDVTASILDNDYVTTNGDLTFPPGTTARTIFVPVTGDTRFESNETFTVTLSNPENVFLGNSLATGTILNDDVPTPTNLRGMTSVANGAVQFGFTNISAVPFTVLTTTNLALPLSAWSILGGPIEAPPGSGQYQFTDLLATNSPQRFYCVSLGQPSKLRWASQVLGYSSAFGVNPADGWSAAQALGEPNIYPEYGDIPTSWATLNAEDPNEYLELGFDQPAPISSVSIYETYAPGAVSKVSVRNPNNNQWVEVWSGPAAPAPAEARIFTVTFPQTIFPVSAVRIDLDSPAVPDWNEIDAVSISW